MNFIKRIHNDLNFRVREDDLYECKMAILKDWRMNLSQKQRVQRSLVGEDDPIFVDKLLNEEQFFQEIERIVDNAEEDSYFSINSFCNNNKNKRKTCYVRHLNAFVLDYDYYKKKEFKELTPLQMYKRHIRPTLPCDPTYVIDSGRGLYVLYCFEHASVQKVRLYQAIYRAFLKTQKQWGMDPKAMNVTQVIRVPGSLNTKSLTEVEILIENDTNYTIFQLRDIVCPYTVDEVLEYKKNKSKELSKKKKSVFDLPSTYRQKIVVPILNDLEKLVELRDGQMNGYREYTLYLINELCFWGNVDEEERKVFITSMNESFSEPLSDYEVFHQALPPRGYQFHSAVKKIVEKLEITEEEQEKLKKLHTVKVQRRKHQKEKRRSAITHKTKKQTALKERRDRICRWFLEGKDVNEIVSLYMEAYKKHKKTFKNDMKYILSHQHEFKLFQKALLQRFKEWAEGLWDTCSLVIEETLNTTVTNTT